MTKKTNEIKEEKYAWETKMKKEEKAKKTKKTKEEEQEKQTWMKKTTNDK